MSPVDPSLGSRDEGESPAAAESGVAPPAEQLTHRLWRYLRWCWIGYWVLLFVIMHIPVKGIPMPHFDWFDKVVHASAYAVLTVLGGVVCWLARRRLTTGMLLGWAGVYLLYAAVDELLQGVPLISRTPDLADWAADTCGVILGTGVLFLARWIAGRMTRDRDRGPA